MTRKNEELQTADAGQTGELTTEKESSTSSSNTMTQSIVDTQSDESVGKKKEAAVALGNPRNNLREFRIEQMMSKAELARKAGLSVLTIDRIEKGFGCRMDTKRKILKALGFKLTDRRKVFKEE
jgi:DNA-binding XRE family transcriptional regulator